MDEILTSITSFAVSVFREKAESSYAAPDWFTFLPPSDPALRAARDQSFILLERHPSIADLTRRVFAEPDLAHLATAEGQLDPMVLHAGGGTRMPPQAIIVGLLSAALLKIYFFGLPREESTFVRLVLEGFDELRRAVRGERVRAYLVSGLAGVGLPDGAEIRTPWGSVRPLAKANEPTQFAFDFGHQAATCVLLEPRLLRVVFDRAPQPEFTADSDETQAEAVGVLLPLAFALASPTPSEPVVPVVTWSTHLLPFQGSFAYSFPFLPPYLKPPVDIGALAADVEEWARLVHNCHVLAVDIAAKRLASAAAHRMDRADSLIDAVMVWENLVGTTTELTFRVTAALAKLLEHDPAKRRPLRKSLAETYNVRSRVVHGGAVDQSELDAAASDAIAVAVEALRASYHRGRDWLSLTSNERADLLLLEEP